jgi:hypothetical protein
MAQSVIGALRVVLGMDTAQFEAGSARAKRGLAGLSASMARFGAVVATAAAAAAAGMTLAFRRTARQADEMTKLAQSIGIPVAELSALKHAADLSGVGLNGLAAGARRVSANMNDIAHGVGETARRAFDDLGLSATDAEGRLKGTTAIMLEVADRFAAMEDSSQKTALAVAIFGRQGAALIPMLNQGAAGIRAMMGEAERLGIVIDERTGRAAEEFNDNLTRLGRIFDGLMTQVAANLLPTLAELTNTIFNAALHGELLKDTAIALSVAFKVLVSSGVILGAVFLAAGQAIATVWNMLRQVLDLDFSGALADLNDGLTDIRDTALGTADILKNVWGTATEEALASTQRLTAALDGTFGAGLVSSTTGAARNIGEVKLKTDELSASAGTFSQTLASGFSDLIVRGQKFSDVLRGIADRLADQAIQVAFSALFSGSGNGGLSSLFAGFFADGGRIGSGRIGMVGERGPELVAGPATVTPMAGGAGLVYAPTITAGMTAMDRAWLRGELVRSQAEAVRMMERRQGDRLRGRSDAIWP